MGSDRYNLIQGDVLDVLRDMESESVQCCVTSPPYWGLRAYLKDADPLKAHELGSEKTLDCLGWAAGAKCGECHICKMTAVFSEVRRVLRSDGTLFLNYGDCYATAPNGRSAADTKAMGKDDRTFRDKPQGTVRGSGLKPKDLCMVPARVALALQSDGWYLRSEIVWAKKAPMPESVTDRPTSAHEKIFLLSKSATYFYDQDAVREAKAESSIARYCSPRFGANNKGNSGEYAVQGGTYSNQERVNPNRNLRNVWTLSTEPLKSVPVYGRRRIASEDCPIHGCQAHPENVLVCDEQRGVSSIDHILRTDDRLSQPQGDAVFSNGEDRPVSPSDETSAILHSSQNRKTAVGSKTDETSGDIPEFHTAYTEPAHRFVSTSDRTHGNSIGLDSSPDGLVTNPSVQMPFCNTDTTEAQEEPSALSSSGNGDELNSRENNTAAGSDQHGHSAQKQTDKTGIEISAFEEPPIECTCNYTRTMQKSLDHYAAFPTIIPKRAILAGTSERGCCPVCGACWVRTYDKTPVGSWAKKDVDSLVVGDKTLPSAPSSRQPRGWTAGCECDAEATAPCTVLDPFAGSGTTLAVAVSLGRYAIGIELSEEYVCLAHQRIAPYAAQGLLFDTLTTDTAPEPAQAGLFEEGETP